MRIALVGPVAAAQRERLQRLLAFDADIVVLPHEAPVERLAADLVGVDAVVARLWPRGLDVRGLRLLQLHAAGSDGVDAASVPASAVVCNALGHEPAIAEFVVHGLLRAVRCLPEMEAEFRAEPARLDARNTWRPTTELGAMTVGILGLGGIGIETARRLRAFGCRIVGCNRSWRDVGDLLDAFFPIAELDAFCAGCDALVVACALTEDTRALVGLRQFRAMNRGAVVVNVARGEIIDFPGLRDALQQGVLGGAVLDVWHDDRSTVAELMRLPGLIATPHISGLTKQMLERRWAQVAGNLDRLARGEALCNVISLPA